MTYSAFVGKLMGGGRENKVQYVKTSSALKLRY
jgi:hypothetical protein